MMSSLIFCDSCPLVLLSYESRGGVIRPDVKSGRDLAPMSIGVGDTRCYDATILLITRPA